MKLTPGQHRLQHIAGIHGSFRLACSYNSMELIDKQNNLSVALLHLIQNGLQSFLKFTPVLGSRQESPHIQGKQLLIF